MENVKSTDMSAFVTNQIYSYTFKNAVKKGQPQSYAVGDGGIVVHQLPILVLASHKDEFQVWLFHAL